MDSNIHTPAFKNRGLEAREKNNKQRREINMKRLGKKTYSTKESIQAYACSSCDGYNPQCGNDINLGAQLTLSRYHANISWGN